MQKAGRSFMVSSEREYVRRQEAEGARENGRGKKRDGGFERRKANIRTVSMQAMHLGVYVC
eukprot:75816-Chlamydomonas_euryale.AAC.4